MKGNPEERAVQLGEYITETSATVPQRGQASVRHQQIYSAQGYYIPFGKAESHSVRRGAEGAARE